MATTVHFIGREKPITLFFAQGSTEPTAQGATGQGVTVKGGQGSTEPIGQGATGQEPTVEKRSKTHLFLDDTILTLKQKILEELQVVLPGGEPLYSNDLYVFATVYRRQQNPVEWVKHIQQYPPTRRQVVFKQVLSNLGYSQEEIEETSVSIPENVDTHSLDPWIKDQARIPLGIRPAAKTKNADFFPVHPLEAYSYEPDNMEWVSHQNETLLEYGELVEPVLYACLYRDIPEEHRSQYGMSTRAVKTTPQTRDAWRRMENLQAVYDWTQGQGQEDRPETKSGITHLELEWIHPHYAVLPLEVIFKNIHANQDVPFIKWKNMTRLYCATRDDRGNKVPVLSKMEIAKIDRENMLPHLTLWTDQGIVLYLMKNGNLQIHVDRKTPMLPELLQQFVLDTAAPIVRQLNQYLQKTGFSYPIQWDDLFRNDPTTVRISHIGWSLSAKLQMQTTIQKQQLIYLDPAFVLLTADAEKKVSQAHMTYRRVSNYDALNEIKEIIRLELGQKPPTKTKTIVSELEKRGFPRDKIQATLQEVFEELQAGKQYFQKKEKKFGCPVLMIQRHNEIHFTVENIPFVQNTLLLKQYIEAFIQKVFYKNKLPSSLRGPVSTGVPAPVPVETEIPVEPVQEEQEEQEEEQEEQEEQEEEQEEEEEEEDATGLLLFNDEDEDEEDAGTVKEMLQLDIPDVDESPSFLGGAKKTNASFSILNRLKERDPELFDVPDQNGKVYSRICPGSSSRYPIVLSKEEKTRIDEKDRELNQTSYTEPLEYKNNTYVCPRYWNFRENRSMNQAEFDRNPNLLQNLIVDEKDAKNDANDRYIYEFKKGKRFDKNNQYKEHVPGFSSKNKKGFCLPCCFSEKDATFKKTIQECKTLPSSQTPPETEEPLVQTQPEKVANANYILGINIYPLEAKRWGQIPPPIQHVVSKTPPANTLLLRYGVERREKQSFLACLADLLDISVKEIKRVLTTQVITLDKFVQYQTGLVASRFSGKDSQGIVVDTEKYQETAFYKSLDLENPDENGFLMDTLKTYERFIEFLNSDDTKIDPTYLWDVIATPDDDLFSTGLNMVVLEMETNEDMELHVMCPAQLYSNTGFYDEGKPTWVLVKRPLLSGEDYYEPIYGATKRRGVRGADVTNKVFLSEDADLFFPFLTTLDKSACFGGDKRNPREFTAGYVADLFQKNQFRIQQQVVNRYGKTVGFVVENPPLINSVYIPCYPSVFLPDANRPVGGERVRLNAALLQKPLLKTLESLQGIQEKTGLPCRGVVHVVRYGDNPRVIGIKTEYGGYIPVVPEAPSPASSNQTQTVEYSSDPIEAEMGTNEATAGEDLSKKYFLENEFFLAFQGKMRNLLNEYNNENIRKSILRWIQYKPTTTEKGDTVGTNATFLLRYNRVLSLIRQVAEGKIIFNDFDQRVLDKLQGVFACQTDASQKTEAQPYCLLRGGPEGGEDKMVFPKKNLVHSGDDNETLYFSKLADALVRNHRIQNIVFQPFRFFNMLGSVDYQVNEDELLV